MPGYVEDIASPIKSKIDLVPVLMKVMSLTLNIGKKNTKHYELMHIYMHNLNINVLL